jgi:hypothetical protein
MNQTATAVVRFAGSTRLTLEARCAGGRLTSNGARPPAIPGSLARDQLLTHRRLHE